MKEKLAKRLHELVCVVSGALLLVLFVLGYIHGLNGYQVIGLLPQYNFLGFVIGFFQFLHLVAILFVLGLGIIGLLQKSGVIEYKKALKGWDYNKFVRLAFIIMAGLSLLVLFFIIIMCDVEAAVIGVGSILNCVLEVIICASYWILDNMGMLNGDYVAKGKATDEEVEQELPKEEHIENEKVEENNKEQDSTDFE